MPIKTFIGPSNGSWATAANWSPSALPTSSDDVIIDKSVSEPAGATSTRTIKSLTVNDPDPLLPIPTITNVKITVTDYATFNGRSRLNITNTARFFTASETNSIVTFNDSSQNFTSNINFNSMVFSSSSASLIINNPNYDYSKGRTNLNGASATIAGSVFTSDVTLYLLNYGTVIFSSLVPVIFNITNNKIWSSNTTNYIFNGGTPTWNFDTFSQNNGGIIYGNCFFTNDSFNNGIINGNCTFDNNSYNFLDLNTLLGGYIVGNCTFNNNSFNSNQIVGNCTFDNSSYNYDAPTYPSIDGNCEFNNNSRNYGTIDGNAIFKSGSVNNFNINGSVTLLPDQGLNRSSVLGVI